MSTPPTPPSGPHPAAPPQALVHKMVEYRTVCAWLFYRRWSDRQRISKREEIRLPATAADNHHARIKPITESLQYSADTCNNAA